MPRVPAAALLALPLAVLASLLAVQKPVVAAQDSAAWLSESSLTPQQQTTANELLADRPLDLPSLDRLVRLYAKADPATAELAAAIDQGRAPEGPSNKVDPTAITADVSLRVAAEHFIHRRYGECLAWLQQVDAAQCASPELALYYRAVSHHQLGEVARAGEAAEQLLALDKRQSRRSEQLARMIQRQAEAHKEGSLTHIALLMEDVERRFDLERSAPTDQQVQQDVIDALDKLIEQAEEQQRQQQQQQQQQQQIAQSENPMPSRPMDDSRPAELRGSGEVRDADLPPGGDWGDLPPAERERVTQQIIREFPAHYRDVIEDYFRSLARQQQSEEDAR